VRERERERERERDRERKRERERHGGHPYTHEHILTHKILLYMRIDVGNR
jgi:hypothetical protein